MYTHEKPRQNYVMKYNRVLDGKQRKGFALRNSFGLHEIKTGLQNSLISYIHLTFSAFPSCFMSSYTLGTLTIYGPVTC